MSSFPSLGLREPGDLGEAHLLAGASAVGDDGSRGAAGRCLRTWGSGSAQGSLGAAGRCGRLCEKKVLGSSLVLSTEVRPARSPRGGRWMPRGRGVGTGTGGIALWGGGGVSAAPAGVAQ